MTAKKRDCVFDLIRLYSMLMVITHHFLIDYLKYESVPLKIVNGKYGVQLFAIILGIFAYRSGRKNKEDTLHYALRRYAYFLICGFVINSIYYFFNIDGSRLRMSFGYVIGQSVLLDCDIFPTFWFVREYLIGSFLSFIIGKMNCGKKEILIITLAMAISSLPHVAACVMGCLADILINEDPKLFRNRFFRIAVFPASLLLRIVLTKSPLTYFIFGICSLLEIVSVKKSDIFTNLPWQKGISYLGSLSMSMLLIHPCLIQLVNRLIILDNELTAAVIRYALLLVLVLISSAVLDVLIRFLVKIGDVFIDLLFDKAQQIPVRND